MGGPFISAEDLAKLQSVPASAPQGTVDKLVAEVLQWQKDIGEARLPEQSATASEQERNLAQRIKNVYQRGSAEDLAKLQSVPSQAKQGTVDQLVADVLQWQEEIGEARSPQQSDAARRERPCASGLVHRPSSRPTGR